MSNNLWQQLVAALPPPSEPLYANGDWSAVEARWDRQFPADYQQFVNTYGQGSVGFLWFPSPLGPDFETYVERWLDIMRGEQDYFEQGQGLEVPYPMYPDADGILPIAVSENPDRQPKRSPNVCILSSNQVS